MLLYIKATLFIDLPFISREELPGAWAEDLDKFQAMIVLKALRPDKVTNSMQDYLAHHMGQRFIEPQASDLGLVYKDSSPTTPLVFVLSAVSLQFHFVKCCYIFVVACTVFYYLLLFLVLQP